MIKGVHTMFYSAKPEELRAFIRDKLGFRCTDVGDGWLIFDLPEADMGCHPAEAEDGPCAVQEDRRCAAECDRASDQARPGEEVYRELRGRAEGFGQTGRQDQH